MRTAATGAQGLAAAQNELPDAILLDVMMPLMNGPEVFALLRHEERLRDVPVVFLTAKAQPAQQRQLALIGATGVLAKLLNPLKLAEELSQALGWY